MTDIAEAGVNQAEGQQEEAVKAKSGRRKAIFIGALILALLGAAGGGAWFFFQQVERDRATDVAPAAATEVYFYDLPELTVNLNTAGQAAEFLKLSIALEVQDRSMIGIIEPRMPRVLDAFQVYLRELRREDLEGSAGIYRLKEELQRRVNLAVYPASVDNILFKEILIQ